MNVYEEMLQQAYDSGLFVIEAPLFSHLDAFCNDDEIYINLNKLDTIAEKRCALSEEKVHCEKTVGDITDQTKVENVKQERFARGCSYFELLHPDKIVKALLSYCSTLQEMCENLTVTEDYFCEAISYYKQKYGLCYRCKDYTLYFEPLSVVGSSIME